MAGEKASNKMNLLGAISYIIGNIVGSGIFITPTAILKNTNSVGLSLIIWLVSAIVSIIGAFCYIELGTSIRSSGADFAYLCFVKWYPVAFAFICVNCFVNYPAIVSVNVQTFSEYLFKGFNISISPEWMPVAKRLLEFSLLYAVMFLNFFSLKRCVSRFNIVASAAKLITTATVIVTGFYLLIFKGKTEHFQNPFEGSVYSIGGICTAFFAGLFTYDGWDVLNIGLEEIENPERTLPLALIGGMSVVTAIYLSANIAYFTVLDVASIENSQAVASTFAEQTLGRFSVVIPFLICVLLIGSINSTIFGATRFLHEAARRGFLPSCISCTSIGSDSPRAAIIFHVSLVTVMSCFADVDALLNYCGFAQWSQRTVTIIALFYIRFKKVEVHSGSLRYPIVLPLIFFAATLSLVLTTLIQNHDASLISVIILAAAFCVFFVFIYDRALPSVTRYQKISRFIDEKTTVFTQIILNSMPQRSRKETDKVAPVEEQNKKENNW